MTRDVDTERSPSDSGIGVVGWISVGTTYPRDYKRKGSTSIHKVYMKLSRVDEVDKFWLSPPDTDAV